MGAMTWSRALALGAVAAVTAWSPSMAQSASKTAVRPSQGASLHACSLLTEAEVEEWIVRGQETYGQRQTDEATALAGGGSVCYYPVGAQIILFSGPKSQSNLEALLRSFKRDKETRHPVSGVGDRAYIMFPPPRNEYEDKGPFLVTSVGPHTLAVSLAARKGTANSVAAEYCRQGHPDFPKEECEKILRDKGETAESLQPAVVELAKVLVAKLRAGT